MRPRGRPPLAPNVSQIPATKAPAFVHDALVVFAGQQHEGNVSAAVREAVISHLQNHGALKVGQTTT